MPRQDSNLSYSDLSRLGWPDWLVEDYQGMKRNDAIELIPQRDLLDSGGVLITNPENNVKANMNGLYIVTTIPSMWYNPTDGSITGWIQLV